MKKQEITLKTVPYLGLKHTELRMFFNRILVSAQMAEPGWWGDGTQGYSKDMTFELWHTHACINDSGTGMDDVARFTGIDLLTMRTEFGTFELRERVPNDKPIKGVNSICGVLIMTKIDDVKTIIEEGK